MKVNKENPRNFMLENIEEEKRSCFRKEFISYTKDPLGFQRGEYSIHVLNMIKKVVDENGSLCC